MTPALKGWHRGERIVRQRLGYDKLPETALFYLRIHAEMPEQHSTFYSTRLEFLPVCVLDEDGRPWSSILADKDGKLGFVRHPKFNTLDITAKLWPGEPFWKVLKAMELGQHPALIAGVGVEVSTRRRNKFAGKVLKAAVKGDIVDAQLLVNEALGFVFDLEFHSYSISDHRDVQITGTVQNISPFASLNLTHPHLVSSWKIGPT